MLLSRVGFPRLLVLLGEVLLVGQKVSVHLIEILVSLQVLADTVVVQASMGFVILLLHLLFLLLHLGLQLITLGFLGLYLDFKSFDALGELLVAVFELKLIQLSGTDLTLKEVVLHLELLPLLLQANELFLLYPISAVYGRALCIELVALFD